MTDIDDLSDSEQYNEDDFVVGSPSVDKEDTKQDDEQHTQKVNGQMEQLQMTVKDLEAKLEEEKNNHEQTKEAWRVEKQNNNSSSSSTADKNNNATGGETSERPQESNCSRGRKPNPRPIKRARPACTRRSSRLKPVTLGINTGFSNVTSHPKAS